MAPPVPYFDLLDPRTFLELSSDPGLLTRSIKNATAGSWICIDEIQKLPILLDEVHKLIEEKRWNFALSGSSARKLKRQGSNLLGGRAVMRKMLPFCAHELQNQYDLDFAMEWGNLPFVFQNRGHEADNLVGYVQFYLQHEIQQEGLVRRLDSFNRFLRIAGQLNGQILNLENLAREAYVKRSTANDWFIILEHTLLGFRLPAWRPGFKVREIAHPKFYWFDPGVARAAANYLSQKTDPSWQGAALKTVIIHEIRCYLELHQLHYELFYYNSQSQFEVDLIIECQKKTMAQKALVICIEIKNSKAWDRYWEKSLRLLMQSEVFSVHHSYIVTRTDASQYFDKIHVHPAEKFLALLHQGEVIPHNL